MGIRVHLGAQASHSRGKQLAECITSAAASERHFAHVIPPVFPLSILHPMSSSLIPHSSDWVCATQGTGCTLRDQVGGRELGVHFHDQEYDKAMPSSPGGLSGSSVHVPQRKDPRVVHVRITCYFSLGSSEARQGRLALHAQVRYQLPPQPLQPSQGKQFTLLLLASHGDSWGESQQKVRPLGLSRW